MSRNLNGNRARDGKAEEPLRLGPGREPQGDTPKGGRPDWKKASVRKVRETTAPAEPERRGDGQPPLEQAAPVLQDDPFQPTPNPTPEPEQEEPDAAPHEVESPRGPDRPDPHGGPASRLRFDKESDTVKPDKAASSKGPRPAGRGPSPSQEAGAGMGQSVPKDSTGGKFRKESNQDKVNRAKFRMEQREGKLNQASRKLAKQKPLKPKGPVRSVLGAAGWGVHGYVHGKIYENEHENVGIEGH